MNRMRKVYGCPVELSLELLGGKWKSVILAYLKDCPRTYGELRQKVLSDPPSGDAMCLSYRRLIQRLIAEARRQEPDGAI